MKHLYRSDKNRILAGIFGGLGEYLNVDPTVLCVLWIFIVIFTAFFPGVFVYILAYFVIPRKR